MNQSPVFEQLLANGLEALDPYLLRFPRLVLGERFEVLEPYAVGGQSILWITQDLQQPGVQVLTRMPLLPYHRPAYLKDADILRGRCQIQREGDLLKLFDNSPLPKLHGLFIAANPLLTSEREKEITNNEHYLVMEWIHGINLDQWVRKTHFIDQIKDAEVYIATWQDVLHMQVRFGCQLLDHGYLYADLRLDNLIISENGTSQCVRIIDPGSIVPEAYEPDYRIPFSWAYLSPEYHNEYKRGNHIWPTQESMIYSLGIVLWQILAGKMPNPGKKPDMVDPQLISRYPQPLIKITKSLLDGEYQTLYQLKTEISGFLG